MEQIVKKGRHQAKRHHDICCGHRVVGHEGKCRHLHGHNYRIHFVCESEFSDNVKNGLDMVGRVIDFGEIKSRLCMWLEENWDHKFLVWERDGLIQRLLEYDEDSYPILEELSNSFVTVPFNPTAENIAQYLVEVIGPQQLEGTGIRLVEVTVEETAKCSTTFGY